MQVMGAAYFFYLVATNFSQRSAYSCSGSGGEHLSLCSTLCGIGILDHSHLLVSCILSV